MSFWGMVYFGPHLGLSVSCPQGEAETTTICVVCDMCVIPGTHGELGGAVWRGIRTEQYCTLTPLQGGYEGLAGIRGGGRDGYVNGACLSSKLRATEDIWNTKLQWNAGK